MYARRAGREGHARRLSRRRCCTTLANLRGCVGTGLVESKDILLPHVPSPTRSPETRNVISCIRTSSNSSAQAAKVEDILRLVADNRVRGGYGGSACIEGCLQRKRAAAPAASPSEKTFSYPAPLGTPTLGAAISPTPGNTSQPTHLTAALGRSTAQIARSKRLAASRTFPTLAPDGRPRHMCAGPSLSPYPYRPGLSKLSIAQLCGAKAMSRVGR